MLQRLRTAAYYAAVAVAGYKLVTHVNSLREPEHVLLASREAGLGAAASELELTPHHFLSAQRLLIFTRRWLTTNARAKGNVFIVHGLGEHMGRYEHVAAALTAAGFNVFGVDHQGHGRSEGERGYATEEEREGARQKEERQTEKDSSCYGVREEHRERGRALFCVVAE